MKGFIRILESIIASIIILSSLTFFFAPSTEKLGWEDSFIHMEMHDSVESIYKSGRLADYVRRNDAHGLGSEISSLTKRNIDFSVSIKGIPNSDILVSCLCSDNEEIVLEGILGSREFSYNGRTIRIGIEKAEISQNTILMRRETNVLFIFNYMDMTPFAGQLEDFLGSGGGILMIANINENQVNDGFMNTTFNLRWEDSGVASGDGVFYGKDSPANVSFKIYKYFTRLSGEEGSMDKFDNGPDINKISADDSTVLIDTNGKYSHAKAMATAARGRVVWFADYDRKDANTSLAVKSSVMWSSGEFYRLDTSEKNIPQVTSKAAIEVYDRDPYEFGVEYWNIF